ncbi:MAG: rod shape-determining protein MreD [Myxococcota bacterium]|jgi:rod shape-determining protein MreD
MKRALAAFLIGLFALGLQAGLATSIPRELCPDLGLLVVLAVGLHWDDATSGLLVSSALGFAADLLSAAVFGTHALLRVLVFTITAVVRSQVDLRGGAMLALFAAGVTLLYSLGVLFLSGLTAGSNEGVSWSGLGGMFPHALINGLFAPLVYALVSRACDRAEGEANRPGLEIDAHRPSF